MAVKQNVVECVNPSKNDVRLSLILRALQQISSRDGLKEKWAVIVRSLGVISVPSDPAGYMKFISDIKIVRDNLAKECCSQERIFLALKALYDEISDVNKQYSPVMSIVLQLLDEKEIPNAVRYILNTGYQEQNLERALQTLCGWLTKWMWTDNLGPLVLAFMKGLEAERHYEILVEVTIANIENLFKLVILPKPRKSIGPVVLYMLSRVQDSPVVFHKIIPHVEMVCRQLDNEKSDCSLTYLQAIVNLCMALMEHFPDYPNLYEPLKLVLQPYCPSSDYKESLHCHPWSDGSGSAISSRCSIGKVGLNNLGNTCYMNSVLQALFMTKTFRNEVLLDNKNVVPLFSKLQILFALLQYSKKFSLSPCDILQSSRPPGFLPGHQHDSSEFLGYLLDTLHEHEETTMVEGAAAAAASPASPTIVQQSFGGRSTTTSQCGECGTRSERSDDFRDLQLAFPGHGDDQSVQALLDFYLQPEKLSDDNQYRCDVCGRLTDGERITKIVHSPARLILTLKHFRYDPSSQLRTKLLQRVQLDQEVALGGHKYELYAAVVHCGSSVDSGHYYTFAREAASWYKFNDCSVARAAADELRRLRPPETPYILFYGRQDVSEPESLPRAVLSGRLQRTLLQDHSEFEAEARRRPALKSGDARRGRDDDDPPPPGCGGGGFAAAAGNMFVC